MPTKRSTDGAEIFQFRTQLLHYASRRLGGMHVAQDIVQEAFLRWYQGDRSAVASPFSWLVTVVNRLCVDYWRRNAREVAVADVLPKDETFPGAVLDQWCDVIEAISLAACLNEEQRTALILREVFEWPYADVARIMNKTSVACRQVVHRARVLLQRSRPERGINSELAERFLAAIRDDDPQGALKLLYQTDSAA
jgi:RNA polymerase sigma-70 factor (ECF subfamily)